MIVYSAQDGVLVNATRSDAGWVTERDRFPGRVVLRRRVVEMARNPDRNTAVNGRASGPRPASPASVLARAPSMRVERVLQRLCRVGLGHVGDQLAHEQLDVAAQRRVLADRQGAPPG